MSSYHDMKPQTIRERDRNDGGDMLGNASPKGKFAGPKATQQQAPLRKVSPGASPGVDSEPAQASPNGHGQRPGRMTIVGGTPASRNSHKNPSRTSKSRQSSSLKKSLGAADASGKRSSSPKFAFRDTYEAQHAMEAPTSSAESKEPAAGPSSQKPRPPALKGNQLTAQQERMVADKRAVLLSPNAGGVSPSGSPKSGVRIGGATAFSKHVGQDKIMRAMNLQHA